jgi:hypothetical protein
MMKKRRGIDKSVKKIGDSIQNAVDKRPEK